jgi:hypothetical protein
MKCEGESASKDRELSYGVRGRMGCENMGGR